MICLICLSCAIILILLFYTNMINMIVYMLRNKSFSYLNILMWVFCYCRVLLSIERIGLLLMLHIGLVLYRYIFDRRVILDIPKVNLWRRCSMLNSDISVIHMMIDMIVLGYCWTIYAFFERKGTFEIWNHIRFFFIFAGKNSFFGFW